MQHIVQRAVGRSQIGSPRPRTASRWIHLERRVGAPVHTYATQWPDVSAVIEGILGQHMTAQATMLDHFIFTAEAAGWTGEEIHGRLSRIVDSTTGIVTLSALISIW